MPKTSPHIYNAPAGAVTEISESEFLYRKEHKNLLRRAGKLEHKHGIPASEIVAALNAQGGKCLACQSDQDEIWFKLAPDYNPITRKLFGLFCRYCAATLATAKRDPELLRRLADHAEQSAKG